MLGDLAKMGVAAVLEIAGCLLILEYTKNGRASDLIIGTVLLVAFAWALTFVKLDDSGRVFAAYGGIYLTLAAVWAASRIQLSAWDLVGIALSIIGSLVIVIGHRL